MDTKARVMNICFSFGFGGMEKVAVDYGAILGENLEMIINVFRRSPILMRYYAGLRNIVTFKYVGNYNIFTAFKIARLVKKHNITHVIVHGRRAARMVILARYLFGMKSRIIAVKHTSFGSKYLGYFDKILVLNQFEIDQRLQKKTYYVPNFIDLNRYKLSTKLRQNEIVVGWIGRFDAIKRLDLLIDIAKKTEARGYKFLVFGGNKEDLPDKDIILGQNIEFCGWVSDVQSVFDKIDILCVTSASETFCMVALEALASGVPVVSTPTNGPRSIAMDNEDGIYISRDHSTESMVELLANLASLDDQNFTAVKEHARSIAKLYDTSVWLDKISRILSF